MIKEDKQLKKEELIKLLCSFVAFNAETEGTQKVIFVGEQQVFIDELWNWINKHYVSKSWVEKELLKPEKIDDGIYSSNDIEIMCIGIRNGVKKEQINKLKEKK